MVNVTIMILKVYYCVDIVMSGISSYKCVIIEA